MMEQRKSQNVIIHFSKEWIHKYKRKYRSIKVKAVEMF